MSLNKHFQLRQNVPQIGLQSTLQGSRAFGLRVSPINVIPLSTKADNGTHRRTIEDHNDAHPKLSSDTHSKKIIPPIRKGVFSRANICADKAKEIQPREKLPKSAPNNINSRMCLKQGVRSHDLNLKSGGNSKRVSSHTKRSEDKEDEEISERRYTEIDGSSTQRDKISEGNRVILPDDAMTEVTSSDGQTIMQEDLKTKLSLGGPDPKYNRKYRISSRGQDTGSDQVEDDASQDIASRDGQFGNEEKRKEEEGGEEKSWQKKSLDFTLSQLTPEKSGNQKDLDIEDKDKLKKMVKSRRKDSILTNNSNNSTRPESEVQNSQITSAGGGQRVRGAFTKEHIPFEDLKKKQEQKQIMRKYLDIQLEEKKRLQEEEKAREQEEQKKEEERIKKELETLNTQTESELELCAQTFGRKKIIPLKKESVSVQHTTVKRPLPRKKTEDDIHTRGQTRGSDEGQYAEPFNVDHEDLPSERVPLHKRASSGEGIKLKDQKGNVQQLMQENDYLWDENQKKGELIDILLRALKQKELPSNPLLSPPARFHTELPIVPDSNRHYNMKSHNANSKQSFLPNETQLLENYFPQNFPNAEFLKTQYTTTATNRRTRPYEYPTEMPNDRQLHDIVNKTPDFTARDFGFTMQGTSQKQFLPHKPQMHPPSLPREMHGFPLKDLASPLKSPTLTSQILQPIPTISTSNLTLNTNYGNGNNFSYHSRALTSPDEVISIRSPLANIPDLHNINYGITGTTRRGEHKMGHGNMNSNSKGHGNMGINANETFSRMNGKLAGSNILVLEDGVNYQKQERKQDHDDHLPSLHGKGGLMKPVRSTEVKDIENDGSYALKGMIPDFARGKSSGVLDQTARFPKDVFAINVKKKF